MSPNIIILSCKRYKDGHTGIGHDSSSWDSIKANFSSNLLFIFYGDETQDELYLYDKENKELCIRTSDSYDNIPLKTWLAYYFWCYVLDTKVSHLITFGDDCSMKDEELFKNFCFSNVDYGGVNLNGPNINPTYHKSKVDQSSYQYNKPSPIPKKKVHWVHEGSGVVFSRNAIKLLLQDFVESTFFQQEKFMTMVNSTCWYNDVLLSILLSKENIFAKKIPYYGIKGDSR